jgi:hypothetical protein
MPNPCLYQTGPEAGQADLLSLYQRLLPSALLEAHRPQNKCVYTLQVVMWLMIGQWLDGHGSLDRAVLELLRGLPVSFWPHSCKRLRAWQSGSGRLSSNTAAYNKARHRLPLSVVEHCCDHIFEQLTAETVGTLPLFGRRAFFFDGTSVQLPSSQALLQSYPPGSNQHGASHWPLLRMLVAHDLQTGLAMRPQWGPANGKQAVSEQQLLDAAIDRLPASSLVVGDANFGVFSVAYAATGRGHAVLLRLTKQRAQRLLGTDLHDGLDRALVWRASRQDRRSHADLPSDAGVQGRVLVYRVQPSNQASPFLLAVFTTCEPSPSQVLAIYGQRWNIETDLRTLKGTLQLEQLRCTTPAMVAKELDLAMAAYNLVRAVTYLAANKAGLPPRAYSFTRVRNVVQAFAPLMAAAETPEQAQDVFQKIMYYVAQSKLPNRRRPRASYQRAIWPRRQSFPDRKE